MNGKEFIKALKNIIEEKSISEDVVYEAMEQGLISAYKKNYESKSNVKVEIDRKTGEFRVYRFYVVVDDYDDGREITDEEGNITYEDPEINSDAQILLEDALKKWPEAKVGEEFREEVTPHDFGRVAASTCKQVVVQKSEDTPKNISLGECIVCHNNLKESVFVPCGHRCVCYNCAVIVFAITKKCPRCNKEATCIIKKVYD